LFCHPRLQPSAIQKPFSKIKLAFSHRAAMKRPEGIKESFPVIFRFYKVLGFFPFSRDQPNGDFKTTRKRSINFFPANFVSLHDDFVFFFDSLCAHENWEDEIFGHLLTSVLRLLGIDEASCQCVSVYETRFGDGASEFAWVFWSECK
jgi:hypothetical protein